MDQKKRGEMRPHLLLTNDDGIEAPGLSALWRTLYEADFADISIIAPSAERSGAGVSITWDRPMQIRKISWSEGISAWSVEGSPADCVKLGMRVILEKKPDLVVSGINAGSNAGRNVLHSGTVGAVIEGLLQNTPGIAFSCEDGENPNFHVAEKYLVALVHYVLENPLREGSFLNVNFPKVAQDRVKGFCLTRQGKGRWREDPRLHKNHKLGASYWLGGKPDELPEDPHCDIALLREGYLTAVPIHIHELTDREELEKKAEKFTKYFHENPKVVV